MSEGPQVLRRTEWLDKHLAGRSVVQCESTPDGIDARELTGRRVARAFCKGKHIFVEFEGDIFLHNHLLMRGTWKKIGGRLLFLPDNAWLSLYVGPYTVCNLGGQVLRLADKPHVEQQLASLGPDAMAVPYPHHAIAESLRSSTLPISEALLRQSLVAGIGNVAKSETLFAARIDPRTTARDLDDAAFDRLLDQIGAVLWASYHLGGRWDCRVYRKAGRSCEACGGRIHFVRLPPSKRATYFCPRCQRSCRWREPPKPHGHNRKN